MSTQLPEGFTLNYNAPSTGAVLGPDPSKLPEGFNLNYNAPADNAVPDVTTVTEKEVADPVATSEGVTVGNYVSSKLDELGSALSEDYQESVERATKAFENQGITGAEKALRITASGFNLAADAIGETVIAGASAVGDGISLLIPDGVEDPIKDKFKQGVNFVLESDAGQAGLEALYEGVEAWQAFAEANPRAAKNIEAVVDIGLFVTPVKGAKGIKPTLPSPLERQAKKQAKLAARTATQKRRQNIVNTFQPVDADYIKRSRDGVLKLSPMEVRAADALQATKKFNVNRSASHNSNVVGKEIDVLNREISKRVINAEGSVDMPQFYQGVTTQFDDLINKLPEATRQGAEVSRVMEALEDSIKMHGNTAKGMLEARRELDKWFKRAKGEEGFNKEGAMVDAVRIARNSINDEIAKIVPESAGLLRKQSGLFYAADGLAEKAAKEGHVFSRVLNNTMKAVGTQRDLAFAAVALTGGAASYGALAVPIAGAAAIGGAGYLLGKPVLKYGLNKAKSRKNLAVMLSGIDKAIKAAKASPELAKQLRADRATLITLVRDLEQVWEEGGEEAFKADQERMVKREAEPLERDPETGDVIIRITK